MTIAIRFLAVSSGVEVVAVVAVLATLAGARFVSLHRERQAAEALRAESEGRLRRIVETASEGIWIYDADGVTTFANAKTAGILGYPLESMIGLSMWDTISDAEKESVAASLARRRQGLSDRVERHLVRADGSEVWVQANLSPMQDARGGYAGTLCLMSDVSQQREMELVIKRREQQLAEAQRLASIGSWEWDLTTQRFSCSEGMYRLCGLPPGTPATAAGLLELLVPEDRSQFEARLRAAMLVGDAFSVEARVQPGRAVEWVQLRAEVLRDQAGTAVLAQGTVQDISASRRASRELAEARDAAMDASRLKSEFLATMSHEIRTPMNGVIGLAGLLLQTDLDETQRRYVEGVGTAGEALLSLINDILDFSKIEAGRLELESVDFDLVEVVEDSASVVAPASQKKGVAVVVACDPALPPVVSGDPGRLRQVLLNLAGNAVKFTANGEVVVRAGRDGGAIRFSVTDTGIGISSAEQERLFEPFSQADSSTTRRYGGSGLGLAISRQLVDAMGGSIGLDSSVGVGSTFWFTVPFGIARDPAAGVSSAGAAGLRVLVVDDHETARLALVDRLLAWGASVSDVDRPVAALETLRSRNAAGEPVQVALIDVSYGARDTGSDGWALCRQIAADATTGRPQLVALVPIAETASVPEGVAVVGCLAKPVRTAPLLDCLRSAAANGADPNAAVGRRPGGPDARPAERHNPASASQDRQARGRVLVVEDNPTNQLVAVEVLRSLGYESDVAGNGAEAVAAVTRRHYDLVLMDCYMPNMDGYTATEELRRLGGADVPIVAMTASATDADRQRALASGMNDYLSKPVRPAELAAVLTRWAGADARHDGHLDGLPNPLEATDASTDEVLDSSRLAMMRRMGRGDGSFLAEIVSMFVEDAPEQIRVLSDAVTAADMEGARKAAHRLKGQAATVGAVALADRAASLEDLAAAGDAASCAGLVERLGREFDRAAAALLAEVGQPDPS